MPSPPPPAALAAILGPSARIARRADIYEEDGTTPWMLDAPLVGGAVNVDGSRDERRTADLTFSNLDGALDNYPEGFWYDKIIKVFRGVTYEEDGDDVTWLAQVGEFMIDQITTQNFPHTTQVQCRDYTEKLLEDQFDATVTFNAGLQLEGVIRSIVLNGGITKYNIPTTGITLDEPITFEGNTTRWKAVKDLATANGYEVFFDAEGYFVMRLYRDPAIGGPSFTFLTGESGNLVSFRKTASAARLYNAVKVTGQKADRTPVVAIAENRDPSSPSSIDRLKRRKVFEYNSSYISEQAQAQEVANNFLKIYSLESFNIDMGAVVLPWLEATEVIDFVDPNPNPGDPRYLLLTNFNIPMDLTEMSATGKRVEIVG